MFSLRMPRMDITARASSSGYETAGEPIDLRAPRRRRDDRSVPFARPGSCRRRHHLRGRIVTLKTPDRHGAWQDIVLGYNSLSEYARDRCYFGALIGRYANRIAGSEFSLNGNPIEWPLMMAAIRCTGPAGV
jgi:hypothetical protein